MSKLVSLKMITNKLNRYYLSLMFALSCMITPAFANNSGGSGGTTLATLAQNVTGTFSDLTKLITGGAYVVGFALAMVGILKLKAHKDNPQQIPISTGLALIFVGAALVFLPTLLGVGASTIFGSDATADVSAAGTDEIIIN